MKKLVHRINNVSLPVAIIIASLILGVSFYQIQSSKQKSIEKQTEAKNEQDNKEYVSKRKKECYNIEQSERKNYNNVDGSFYNEENNEIYSADVCVVRYINLDWNENNPSACGAFESPGKDSKCTIEKYIMSEF